MIDASGNEPFWKFLLFTGLISLLLIFFSFNAQPSEIDDNYHYMNLGRALYEGKGFVRLDTPGHPPEDIVTPGYPLILAGIMKIMGDPKPLIALKIFSSICYLLTILIAVTVFVKFMNFKRWVAFWFAVFMSISYFMIHYASYVLTEAPFMLFVAITVYFVLRYERDKKDLFFYLATLSTVLGIYIRLPGAPLAVAFFLWLIIRKDYKKAIIFGAIAGITVGAWVVPKILSGRFQYGGQFVVKEAKHLEAARTRSYFSRYFYNMGYYFIVVFPRLLFPQISLIPVKIIAFTYTWLDLLIGLPLLGTLILGVMNGIRDKEKGFPYFLFAVYFLTMFFFASRGIRYSTYVFPWFMLALVTGVRAIGKLLENRKILREVIAIVLAVIIIVLAIPLYSIIVPETAVTRQIARKGIKPPLALVGLKRYQNPVELHHLYHACEWIRRNTPETSVIMAPQLRTAYYYSERASLSPKYWERIIQSEGIERDREIRETEIDSMWVWALEQGVTHIVVDPIYGVTRFYLVPAISRYQDCIELIHETPAPKTRVFAVDTTCLRNFIVNNDKALLDQLLREVSRLEQEGDEDSLKSLLERHEPNDHELEAICKFLSYYRYLMEFKDLTSLFEAAQKLYPENGVLWFNWALEHNRMRLVSVSIPAFEKALEFGADSADCYNNLGVAMTLNKDFVKADEFFEKAMFHAPDDPTVLKNRISNLISIRKINVADSILDWATALEEPDSAYRDSIQIIKTTYENWKRSVGL
ncbi:MAG: glycosyltransferase family 39 protein [bacterium]